jgi:hypothetical protein
MKNILNQFLFIVISFAFFNAPYLEATRILPDAPQAGMVLANR